MEAEGFEFRSKVPNAKKRLDKGAMAFCIFVGKELGSVGWAATTQEAKDSLSEPPFVVGFSNNEACVGGLWTNPKYRRMGLRRYGSAKRRRFMLEKGIVRHRGAIPKWNIASQRSVTFAPDIHGEGRYFRFLWWQSWKEKPLT